MDARFKLRREQLLEEAKISPAVYEGVVSRLPEFLGPYVELLGRSEQKEHLTTYLKGLISNLARKNVESIAYLHDQERDDLQHFIGCSRWDYAPLFGRLAQDVGESLGERDGILVFDPSGFKKDGQNSVGVKRQWLGRFGKVENGQVGVYLGYVSRLGYALCDVRLYLPEEWAKDAERRTKAGVPPSIRFQTRHALALEMLAERGQALPHAWVTGDDEMGRCSSFRANLRALSEQYLLDVPSNTNIRDLEAALPSDQGRGGKRKHPYITVSKWREALPDEAWTTVNVRHGEKGPLEVQIIKRRVQARTQQPGRAEELLVITRVREGSGWRTDYHLSSAPPETPLVELARVAKAEHRIEDGLKRAKSEAGLADYEVRTWIGWHHHQVLSLLATWFLTCEARRGEKVDPGDHGTVDAGADRWRVA